MARKSGKELRNDYKELLNKTKSLQKHIIKRAQELAKQYPQVQYSNLTLRDGEKLTIGYYHDNFRITPKVGLEIIECVEEYIANQHPHKQTRMFES